MGWWETSDGLIGDGPVDLVEDRMAEWAVEGIQPSWQQFVDSVGTALVDRGRDWISDPESLSGLRVCARFAAPAPELRNRPDAPRDRYHSTLSDAFQQLGEEYEETQQRKPTLSEALGTLAFSLRVSPERFVRNEDGWKLVTIQSCSSGQSS
jgi:hypothetical protein